MTPDENHVRAEHWSTSMQAYKGTSIAGYNARLDRRMRGTVWTAGQCQSWYLDDSGRNTTLWPSFSWSYRQQTRRFDEAAYDLG